MADAKDISEAILDGEVWRAAGAVERMTEPDYLSLAREIVAEVDDRADVLDMVSVLAHANVTAPGASDGERLRRLEAARMLAAALALSVVGEDWRDLLGAVRVLSTDSSRRVRGICARLVARMASVSFKSSRSVWTEAVLEGDGPLAACVIEGLARADAPAPEILEVFSSVINDARKDVRHALGARAIPELGRREPQSVYSQLWHWARTGGEIARWNVAQALATALGGVYVEQATGILEMLAADERPAVWRAAAAALVQVAQRRPRYVLPILGRWREDESRQACARLALETLARR